ncbi:MAG: hypothetical protein J5764_00620, partial [Bacteroidales bacterium]|nr:hypothetical protein [Bacteroidales bacterium]
MNRAKLWIMPAAAALCAACVSLSGETGKPGDVPVDTALPHDMIVLGEKLEDPYTVENISKAVASLYPSKAGRIIPDPTDYYVRFLPADDGQY